MWISSPRAGPTGRVSVRRALLQRGHELFAGEAWVFARKIVARRFLIHVNLSLQREDIRVVEGTATQARRARRLRLCCT